MQISIHHQGDANFHMNISMKNCLFGYASTLYMQASTDFKNYMLTKNTFFEKKTHLHVQMMS